MTQPAPAGSVLVHRPERTYPHLPPARTVELSPPPATEPEPETGQAPAVLAAVLAALSGMGFAVLSGDPRYLAVCLLLALASAGTGWLSRRASRRAGRRRSEQRRVAYVAHMDRIGEQARAAARRQREALDRTYPSVHDLSRRAALAGSDRLGLVLWQRRPGDVDFGSVRVGAGHVPARVNVVLSAAATAFDPTGEPLRAAAQAIVDGTASVGACPVLLDLRGARCVAVLGPPGTTHRVLRSWLLQVALTHAPAEVRIVVVTRAATANRADDGDSEWGWARWLPHTQVLPRLAGAGAALDRSARSVDVDPVVAASLAGAVPWTLVLVDGAPDPRTEAAPATAHGSDGVTYVVAVGAEDRLPEVCDVVVRLRSDGSCTVVHSGPDGRVLDGVLPDEVDIDAARRIALDLAPLAPTGWAWRGTGDGAGRSTDLGQGSCPQPVALSTLIASRSPAPRLRVPLGRSADGSRVDLDLREAAAGGDGPHGVLVGATGSGKSELLRTLVLALACRSRPDELGLVLVDFKGGATFDALAGLPHVAGLVTNMAGDLAGIARFQRSLEGELDERQQRLRSTGCESVTRLREEATNQPGGSVPDRLPDLLVVVDEFGELLELQPDLLDTFGRIGRLGRSLGVHLLLSSQRLDEGRLRGLDSHLGYRIALRTLTSAESVAVLGTPAAYELPPVPGLGLLRTAGGVRLFRGASTALLRPRVPGRAQRELVRRLAPWAPPAPQPPDPAGRTELAAMVDALRSNGAARTRPVCLPALPERVVLGELLRTHPGRGLVLGVLDRAAERRQEPLRVDLDEAGHLAVTGSARSGRSTLLRTVAAALAAGHDPGRLHLYVLDLGGSLAALRDLPHTAAVAAGHDSEAVLHVLRELTAVAAEQSRDPVLPGDRGLRRVLLVDDVGRLRREHPDAEDQLVGLAPDGRRSGVHLVLAAARWTDLRPALLDAVGARLELRLDEPADSRWPRSYTTSVPPGPGGALSPEGLPARLAIADGTEPLARHPAGLRAPAVVPLPTTIRETAPPGPGRGSEPTSGADGFALGVRERGSMPVRLPLLAGGEHLLLLGDRGSGRTTQLLRAARWVAGRHGPDRFRLHLVDPRRSLLDLAQLPHIAAHAYDPGSVDPLVARLAGVLQARRPPAGLPVEDLVARRWWSGPEHVLVVDDQDLVPGADPSGLGRSEGLGPLAGFLPHAADIGFHVLLARPVTGLARAAYDPFLNRLRAHATATLVLSGDRAEGPVAGGVGAVPLPPGRGRLLREPGGQPGGELVQCLLPPGGGDGL